MERDPADQAAPFESPALLWWVSIPLGLALTGLLAYSDGARGLLPGGVASVLSAALMRVIWWVAAALHVLEGGYAFARASAAGLPAARWGAQTLMLGYPSLRLLLARTKRTPEVAGP